MVETCSLARINILLSKLCRRKQFNFLFNYKFVFKKNVLEKFKQRWCHYELHGLKQLSYLSLLRSYRIAVIMAYGLASLPKLSKLVIYIWKVVIRGHFESLLEETMRAAVSCVFFSVSGQMFVQYLTSGHQLFLSHPFQFTVHGYPITRFCRPS